MDSNHLRVLRRFVLVCVEEVGMTEGGEDEWMLRMGGMCRDRREMMTAGMFVCNKLRGGVGLDGSLLDVNTCAAPKHMHMHKHTCTSRMRF